MTAGGREPLAYPNEISWELLETGDYPVTQHLYRVQRNTFTSPFFFSSSPDNRWSPATQWPPPYGVLYICGTEEGAISETILRFPRRRTVRTVDSAGA